ncbi:MAG TPA: thioredoxin family protein [Candidatus Acidoferrum sp.]|nr:thioredoxin family protein [Candidatus Acidoferrum sp.]
MLPPYSDTPPDRATLDATAGPLIVEFGSNSCGWCRAALPLITATMEPSQLPHVRVQDGKGQRLGRSYGVKLWPTLIMLRDGNEVARVVRPQSAADIEQALAALGKA